MVKVLVAVAFYPDDKGNKLRYYTHVRNQYYITAGIDVTVLNFATDHDYIIDGVRVVSMDTFRNSTDSYDILVCHAPNLRNHFLFLRKYKNNFAKIIFFFHGQEIMHLTKYYPTPYEFNNKGKIFRGVLRNIYDSFKLRVWRNFFLSNKDKSVFVFVSKWLRDVFFKELKITKEEFIRHTMIINNSVGRTFEENSYKYSLQKKYDFITIRNHYDESTYAIDILNKVAKDNPKYNFCLVGQGKFFDHYDKAPNLHLISAELSHTDILKYLDKSRCGLMLTRHDTQGVMSCEMATYGIPLITSNIPVCHEIFDSFSNVSFVNNDDVLLESCFDKLTNNVPYKRNLTYSYKNTVLKEIQLIQSVLERD